MPLGSRPVIDSLVPYLRQKIGDLSSPYRYEDDWLITTLKLATITLNRYLYNKYKIDSITDDIVRDDLFTNWYYQESTYGVIEPQDIPLFIVMGAIILVQGDLESNAWNIGSWKDFEISYSNISAGKFKDENLKRLWDELDGLITRPTKRLATPRKQSLPGYLNNPYERDTKI